MSALVASVAACTVVVKTLMGEMIPVELPADSTVDEFYACVFAALPQEIRPPHALQLSLLSEEEKGDLRTTLGGDSLLHVKDQDVFCLLIQPCSYEVFLNYLRDGVEIVSPSETRVWDYYRMEVWATIQGEDAELICAQPFYLRSDSDELDWFPPSMVHEDHRGYHPWEEEETIVRMPADHSPFGLEELLDGHDLPDSLRALLLRHLKRAWDVEVHVRHGGWVEDLEGAPAVEEEAAGAMEEEAWA